MSKVSALRNSKSRLGEFGHLQASQAAALLTTETYRLMRGPSAGSAADFARELERAAEEIAMKIAQHPSTTTLLRSPRSTVDARLALADFEARLMVARVLGYVAEGELRRLDFFLRYLRLYCSAPEDLAAERLHRGMPDA